MTGQLRAALRPAVFSALVVAAAALCRVAARAAPFPYLESLANYVRVLLYLGLFTAWGASVRRRVVQTQARGYMLAVAALMVLWLTAREYRWHLVQNAALRRYLWYLYYLPILLIPLLALLVSMSLGKSDPYRLPKWTGALYLPTAVLIGLVLTNDLHQWMFAFPDFAPMRSELDYRYGPVFYLVASWVLLCSIWAFGRMLSKCRIPRTGRILWLPLAPFAAAVVYSLLYALRVPFVVNELGDLAVFDCLLFTAFFESCIQCGLIQSNTRHEDLFRACVGISAQIVDEAYTVRYAASGAERIDQEDMRRGETAPVILPEGRRLHNMPIRGGHAIWTEDIAELLALRENLAETRAELQERNEILQMEYRQEREAHRVMEQNRLYDLLRAQTRAQLEEVGRLTAAYETARGEAEKRHILAKIVVLGSYIKRRKDFVLLLEGAPVIPEGRLTSALAESFRSLALAGIRGGYLVDTGRETLQGELITLAYDFFESVVETVLDTAHYVTVQIGRVNGALRCLVRTDCAAGGEALFRRYPAMRLLPDGEGGAACLLRLSGGEGA